MISIPCVRPIGSSPRRIGLATCLTISAMWCLYLFQYFLLTDLIPFTQLDPPKISLPRVSVYDYYFPNETLPKSLLGEEHSLLTDRLLSFLARPVDSHETARTKMEKGCPAYLADQLATPSEMDNGRAFWIEEVNSDEVIRRRAGIVQNLADLAEKGVQIIGKKEGGRGIVLTGGNQDTAERVITVLKHLRRLGNTLNIEVFHFQGEMTDNQQRETITSLGAEIRLAEGVEKEDGVWKNWQIKGMAIVQSKFQEVLYLDSDNIPLRRVEHLFTAPSYLAHGAVFWPDLSKDHPDNAIWRIVGEPCDLKHWTLESGQLLFNKAGNDGLNLAAIWIATGMMLDRSFWFHMTAGDKDTFRWGMRILGLEWSDSPRWWSALGFKNSLEGGRFCGHSMLQYDIVIPEGFTRPPPLFVHANLIKHMNGQDLKVGQLFTHVKHFTNDDYSNPDLHHANIYVYDGTNRGMCTDMGWYPSANEALSDEERESGIREIPIDEIEGRPLAGFEEAWFEEGGRVGGW